MITQHLVLPTENPLLNRNQRCFRYLGCFNYFLLYRRPIPAAIGRMRIETPWWVGLQRRGVLKAAYISSQLDRILSLNKAKEGIFRFLDLGILPSGCLPNRLGGSMNSDCYRNGAGHTHMAAQIGWYPPDKANWALHRSAVTRPSFTVAVWVTQTRHGVSVNKYQAGVRYECYLR